MHFSLITSKDVGDDQTLTHLRAAARRILQLRAQTVGGRGDQILDVHCKNDKAVEGALRVSARLRR